MTKKHFSAIARIIADSRDVYPDALYSRDEAVDIVLDEVVDKLSTYFKAENPRFDAERFKKACE